MFVTVRYGDDRSKIFNSYCKNEVLLANIKAQCGCGQEEIVEVSDERGVVKNLRNYPSDYGSEFLKEREVLVLLTVNNASCGQREDGDNRRPIFTPSLSSLRNDRQFNECINQPEPPAPESPPSSTQGLLDSGTRRQQQQSSPPAEGDDVNAEGKAFRTKVKVLNHLNSSVGGGRNKALLRKSTKALLKK